MLIPALAKRPLKKNIFSKSVTGHSLDTLGTIKVTVKMGLYMLHDDVQVMRNVSEGILFGIDFLQFTMWSWTLVRAFTMGRIFPSSEKVSWLH